MQYTCYCQAKSPTIHPAIHCETIPDIYTCDLIATDWTMTNVCVAAVHIIAQEV